MQSPQPAEDFNADEQQPQAESHLGLLPPDLLTSGVFARVPLLARHRSLALVCRQWAELVHSPALLASLDITLRPARLLPRLDSLLEWMERRAAGHVRRLELQLLTQPWVYTQFGERVRARYLDDDEDSEDAQDASSVEEADEDQWGLSSADEAEAGDLLALAVAVHGSSLQHLDLYCDSDTVALPLGDWMAPLSGLTSLHYSLSLKRDDETATVVDSPLTCLASLQHLQLASAAPGDTKIAIAAGATLPAALTSLQLHGLTGGLSEQLGALRRLRELHLHQCDCGADQYSGLESLGSSLTALTLSICDSVPDCLGELTALRSLVIEDAAVDSEGEHEEALLGARDGAVLEAALPCLQHLTALFCLSTAGLPDSPAALSALQQLETVAWVGCASLAGALPGGPWLGRLRRLALPCRVLADAASLETLSGAQQLEQLGVTDCYRWRAAATKAVTPWKTPSRYLKPELQLILGWAAQQASLQQLVLEAPALKPMAPAVKKAQKAAPGLQIRQSRDVVHAVCGYARDSHYLLYAMAAEGV